jgi:hypothetical protein
METRAGGFTVSVADPLTEPEVAMITEVPCVFEVASPAALIVATAAVAEVQATELVRSLVELSDQVPVALNCWVSPAATAEVPGVTLSEARAAGFTVSVADPLTEPEVAVITDVPCVLEVASPAALTVATPVVAEVQVAVLVRSLVEPSDQEPVALNCWVRPAASEEVPGVTLIDFSEGAGGVIVVDPPPPPEQAVSAMATKREMAKTMQREPIKQEPFILRDPINNFQRRRQDTRGVKMRKIPFGSGHRYVSAFARLGSGRFL